MTFQQLKIFLAVCEEMNYSHAAAKCYISRQALRQNITSLETELCGALFENTSNRLSLTAKGEKLKTEAEPVVNAFLRLQETMLADIDKPARLRIAISRSLIPDYLPSLLSHIEHFGNIYHGIQTETFYLHNDDALEALLNGNAGGAIVLDLGTAYDGIIRTELSSHQAGVLVSDKSEFYGRESLKLTELSGMHLCVPGVGKEMQPLLSRSGIVPDVVTDFYQALYFIREENAMCLNRCLPAEERDLPFVRSIPIEGLRICSSFIYAPSGKFGQQRLGEYLKACIAADFARLE